MGEACMVFPILWSFELTSRCLVLGPAGPVWAGPLSLGSIF